MTKRLRVLTITQEYPPVGGGAASVCRDVAQRLAELGHEVVVVTMGFAGCAEYERTDGVTIFRTSARRRRRDRCTVPEMAGFVLAALQAIRRHPEWVDSSICHAHFIVPGGMVAWRLKRWSGLPYVVTSHGSDVLYYNRRFRFVYPAIVPLWRRVIREASMVTAASAFLAKQIAEHEADARLAIVPNAVCSQRFQPMGKEPRILIVGRLVASKCVSHVIEALSALDLGEWSVDVVGDGPLYPRLQRQVRESRLSAPVTFHGWVPNDSGSMRELYGRAYLFVSASRLENMSIAHLEALSAGCRVITTEVGGSKELGGDVRFFSPGDIRALRGLIARETACYRRGVTPARWMPPNPLDTYASLLEDHARVPRP
jgi:glycosyltransferase involved in cell wall biosynthesis